MADYEARDLVSDGENGEINIGDGQTYIIRVMEVYNTTGGMGGYSNWQSALGAGGLPEKGDGHPMNSAAKVRRYRVSGLGKAYWNEALGAPDYDRAKVVIEYSTTGAWNGQVMLRKETICEIFEVSGGGLFNTSGEPVPVMNIPIYQVRITVPQVGLVADPEAAIRTCMNRVNSSAWKPATDVSTYAAGTLLYCGPSRREQRWDEGVGLFVWDVDHVFHYNEIGWNYAWDPAANSGQGGFDLVVPARYSSASFAGLGV